MNKKAEAHPLIISLIFLLFGGFFIAGDFQERSMETAFYFVGIFFIIIGLIIVLGFTMRHLASLSASQRP